MNEPRSSVMSARTTCGGAIEIGEPGVQRIAKSIRSFAVTFGRMFANSSPRTAPKSIEALAAEERAAAQVDPEDVERPAPRSARGS